jgi:polyribonucleotide nucleotidyltransferase
VQDVRSEVKEGDQILVKVVNIDPSGKIRLSRKALLTDAEGGAPVEGGAPAEAGASAGSGGGGHDRPRGGDRGRDRGGRDRGDRGRR